MIRVSNSITTALYLTPVQERVSCYFSCVSGTDIACAMMKESGLCLSASSEYQ